MKRHAKYLPLLATISLFAAMAIFGSVSYAGFFSAQAFLNLLIDNAFLVIVAVGMTFVILTGGIDLSVGSVVALSTMVLAALVEKYHWALWLAIPLVLLMGTALGSFMGWLIQRFRLQPFIVTLAGMFLARGLCYLISIDSISITDDAYTALAQMRISLWEDAALSLSAVLAVLVLLLAVYLAHATEFGRTVYCQGRLTADDYGRDHHPRCFTTWMAGGGMKPGVVYGETDDYSYNIVKDPVHVHDLNATLLHCMGIDHTKLTYRYQGRDFRLTDVHGEVVKPLLA